MEIRLLTMEEVPTALVVGKEVHDSSRWANISWDDETAKKTAEWIVTHPDYGFILGCWDGDIMAGGICAFINKFPFSLEKFSDIYILFLKKEYRGAQTAIALMKAYIAEAKKHSVREIRTGVNTPGNFRKAERLFEYVGFTKTGSCWTIAN